jgi:hypothetical protein
VTESQLEGSSSDFTLISGLVVFQLEAMLDLLQCKDQCLGPPYGGLPYPSIASDLWFVISDCQYKKDYSRVEAAPYQHPYLVVLSAAAGGQLEQLQVSHQLVETATALARLPSSC